MTTMEGRSWAARSLVEGDVLSCASAAEANKRTEIAIRERDIGAARYRKPNTLTLTLSERERGRSGGRFRRLFWLWLCFSLPWGRADSFVDLGRATGGSVRRCV